MDAERWQRLSPLLDALFELDPPARAARLGELRDEDPALADELQTLIALEEGHEDFLAEPLVAALAGARAGSTVGPYRLESLLGEGGMGQVWLASRADGLYQRRVALKLLRPGLADTNLRIRFTRERQILARLAHPHIARLLDAGISTDGLPYLALEYVEGEPITDYCRNQSTPLDKRLHMFQQICDAVSHAHANLIVHRDLKPSNIMVTPGGDVRLLDFGIAKLLDSDAPVPEQTRTGMRAFTLHYAAPEQVRGEPVTTMTDVYSLGVVLYELLTETKPYRLKRQTDAEWEEAILAADPLRPSQTVLRNAESTGEEGPPPDSAALRRLARQLAGDLDNIVLKTLSKRPEQRYPSVEALALDLQRFEAGRPVQARAQSLGYRFHKYMQRHRWALATGTLVTVVLGVALAIVAWQARQAVQEASRAQAMQDFMVGLFENARGTPEGEALDLRGLLDASVARGNRELARQPRARAELLGVVARLRTGLGDYHEAKTLLDRQARILEVTDDIPNSLHLESLTQRGQVLRLLGEARACIDLMQPWADQARREQAQLPTQAAEFYSQLGRCRRINGERQSARLLFERSLALRREVLHNEVGEVENLMDLAGLQADVGETRAALEGFERAREQLRQSGAEKHPLQVEIGWNIAARLRDLGQVDASEREARNALAIAQEVNGAQHPTTLSARRQVAAIHVDQGRFALAENEFREIRDQLTARLGADHTDLSATYNSLGVIAWERGQLSDAVAALRRAIEIARKHGDTGRLAGTLFNLAMVLHEQGRDREALTLLRESRQLRDARYGVDHPLLGDTDRLEGEVLLALNERDRGLGLLGEAVRQTRAGYGATHSHTRRAELSLAYSQALAGDLDALAQLDALSALPNADIELRKIGWLAQAYAARVRCNGATQAQARERLDILHRALTTQRPDGSAIGREIDSIRANCGS